MTATDIYESLSVYTLLLSKEHYSKGKSLEYNIIDFKGENTHRVLQQSHHASAVSVNKYCKCFQKLQFNS